MFGRRATIAIPDSEVALSKITSRSIWRTSCRIGLPRTVSCSCFHAPSSIQRLSEGLDSITTTRAWCAAFWRRAGFAEIANRESQSTMALFDLLFAKTYGLEVNRPSLNETAAWLSIRTQGMWTNEVVRRSPLLLLITARVIRRAFRRTFGEVC